MKTATVKTRTKDQPAESNDDNVLQVLHKDHQKVAELFFQYKQQDDDDEKQEIAAKIIKELSVHAKVEEEIVYPALRKADKETEDMMDEADTEHHVVKVLLAELEGMSPDDDHYDSKVTVLCELVNHHVQEEEKEIFEKLEEAGLDLDALGAKVLARKAELIKSPPPSKNVASNSRPGSKNK